MDTAALSSAPSALRPSRGRVASLTHSVAAARASTANPTVPPRELSVTRRPASAPTSRPRCAQSAIMITAPSKRPAFPSRPSLLDAEAEALLDAKLISSATPKPVTPKAQRRVSWNFVSPEDAMACLRTQPLTTALDSNATSPVGRPSKAWPIMDVEESDTGNS
eukprot:scaffold80902_cov69-Phaeocystis_antarctica.AAC.6